MNNPLNQEVAAPVTSDFHSKLAAYNVAKDEMHRVKDMRDGMPVAEYLPLLWAAKAAHRAALATMLVDFKPRKASESEMA